MSAYEIHKSDIGTVFTLTIKDGSTIVDLSSTSAKVINFRKPDGTILNKTAAFVTDGTDGKIKYTTIVGDLSQTGPWTFQAVLTFASGTWSSDVHKFTVHPNLADL